jgi:hypothetical protein
MTGNKIRFIQFAVQPIAVVDDGVNLKPLNLTQIAINAEDWDRLALGLPDEMLAQLQARLDAQNGDNND